MRDSSVNTDPLLRFVLNDPPSASDDRGGQPASVDQMPVRRVDNGVAGFSSDVALHNLDRLFCLEDASGQDFVHFAILPR